MSKPTSTHKHIFVGKNVYTVEFYDGKWNCGHAWGPTAEAAAKEYHKHLSNHNMEPITVDELHEIEEI